MSDRVLITGGTGFIGQHAVQALIDADRPVTLLVREEYSAGKRLPPRLAKQRDRFELVFADLRSQGLTTRAVREAGPDRILHLAAAGATDPFLNPDTALRHNVTGTINLLRAAFEKNPGLGVQQFVVARTPGELTSMNVYSASKLAAWDFCRMYARTQNWPIQGAMIFQCYGPGQPEKSLIPAAIQAALTHTDFPMTTGRQQRDWIYIDDVVSGLIQALDFPEKRDPGSTIDLGNGNPISVAEIVTEIYRLSGSMAKPLIGALPSRPGEAQVQQADLERAAREIGWRPSIPLADGLKRTIEHQQSDIK